MNVSGNPSAKSTPVNYELSRKPLPASGRVLLKYDKPCVSETAIGQIPKDGQVGKLPRGRSDVFYDDSFRPNDSLELSGYRRIYSEEPYLKDGKPLFKEAREFVQLGPKSGVKEGVLGGLAGAIVGAAGAAALVGLGIIAAPIGLAAAAVLGAGAGLVARSRARDEVAELKWVETPIVSAELQGFRQTVTSQYRNDSGLRGCDGIYYNASGLRGRNGTYYNATYQPLLTTTSHGSWMKPVISTTKRP